MTKTFRKGKLRVELDTQEVFPDDPGKGTPAVVFFDSDNRKFSSTATYWCAIGEGELCNAKGEAKQLTEKQLEWLNNLGGEIDQFLYGSKQ